MPIATKTSGVSLFLGNTKSPMGWDKVTCVLDSSPQRACLKVLYEGLLRVVIEISSLKGELEIVNQRLLPLSSGEV